MNNRGLEGGKCSRQGRMEEDGIEHIPYSA